MALTDANEIKRRVDILAVIGRVVELRQRGREWWGCCPLHAENTPSFSVNPEKQTFHCFGCGKGGDVLTFIMEHERVDFSSALDLLGGHQVLTTPPIRTAPPPPAPVQVKPWDRLRAGLQDIPGTRAAKYLCSRGIESQLAQRSGARYHPDWYGRPAVVFLMRDRAGAVIAADGRAIRDLYQDGRKARAAGLKREGVFATVGAFAGRELVIVEGAIDALSLAMVGFPAVALCGAGNTEVDWLPIACTGKRVFLGFDNDEAGKGNQVVLAGHIRQATGGMPLTLPIDQPGKDWNNLLCEYGRMALQLALCRVMYSDQAPPVTAGEVVRDNAGRWSGRVLAFYGANELMPCGWCAIRTDDGQDGTADLRALCDQAGRRLAPPVVNDAEYREGVRQNLAIDQARGRMPALDDLWADSQETRTAAGERR